jgi:glutaredoxin
MMLFAVGEVRKCRVICKVAIFNTSRSQHSTNHPCWTRIMASSSWWSNCRFFCFVEESKGMKSKQRLLLAVGLALAIALAYKCHSNPSFLIQNVIRVCPHCKVALSEDEVPTSGIRHRIGQKLAAINLDNDPATIQQLPYKVSGELEVPVPPIATQTYRPAVAIRFTQVRPHG